MKQLLLAIILCVSFPSFALTPKQEKQWFKKCNTYASYARIIASARDRQIDPDLLEEQFAKIYSKKLGLTSKEWNALDKWLDYVYSSDHSPQATYDHVIRVCQNQTKI